MYSRAVKNVVMMAKTATFVEEAHISIKRMDRVYVEIAVLLETVKIVMLMGANHVKIATHVSLESVIEFHSATDNNFQICCFNSCNALIFKKK